MTTTDKIRLRRLRNRVQTPYPIDEAMEKRGIMTETVLSLRDVGLTLEGGAGPVVILRGISLNINRSESIGLIGPSGSGKSSLLMLMGGLEQASTGEVCVLGQDLGAMTEDALARFRRGTMGIVFQSFHLLPTMTALENVTLPLEIAGEPNAMDRARAELSAVGLGHREGHYPASLSGGEQQRVALARALVTRPAILLADEPTGNLDHANGAAVMDLMFGLRETYGTTLILVTHAADLAARCDRVVRIEDGKLVRSPAASALAGAPQ